MKTFAAGTGLTAAMAYIGWLAWGPPAVTAAVVFGFVATAIQVAAVQVLRPVLHGPSFSAVVKRHAIGTGLRLAGIILFAAAVTVDRDLFPPLPTALGYLGVVVPLFFLETTLAK